MSTLLVHSLFAEVAFLARPQVVWVGVVFGIVWVLVFMPRGWGRWLWGPFLVPRGGETPGLGERTAAIESAMERAGVTGWSLWQALQSSGQWPPAWRLSIKRGAGGSTNFIRRVVTVPQAIERVNLSAFITVAHEGAHVRQGVQHRLYGVVGTTIGLMAVPLFFFTGIVAALRMGLLASVVAMIALGCATYSVRMQVGWEADAVYRQGEMIGAWLPQSGLAAPIQDLIREEFSCFCA